MNFRRIKVIDSPRGFKIAVVHYSADEEKDEAWAEQERKKYQSERLDWKKDWDREMEIDFSSVSGTLAYYNYNPKVNKRRGYQYNESLPLLLNCDFNVEPMIWEVCQEVKGVEYYFCELYMCPGNIPAMVAMFRDLFPAHPAEVWVYGDATGRARTSQTAKSDYDMMRLAFKGYASPVIFHVPIANPSQRDRINAVNLKLKGVEGEPGIIIDPDKCPELIKDLEEVKMKEDGTQIIKVSRRDDPYFFRTHASDAMGYGVFHRSPVVKEVILQQRRRPRPYQHYYILGDLR